MRVQIQQSADGSAWAVVRVTRGRVRLIREVSSKGQALNIQRRKRRGKP